MNKLHKIPGVDKSVCTCEQMIAYNFCQTYKEMSGDWCAAFAKNHMDGSRKFDKYDKDMILHLISACKSKTYFGSIASSYAEIGRYFPLPSWAV